MSIGQGLWRGAVAGASGTCALNATTYLDMTLRGRPASSTPAQTVEKIAETVGVPIPGDEDSRSNRLQGLGALTGMVAGVGTGAALGAVRSLGWRGGYLPTAGAAFGLAMLAGNAPMTAMRITDPRSWDATSWMADLVPHVAYAAVAALAVCHLD